MMPCDQTPRRSALIKTAAAVAASGAERPAAENICTETSVSVVAGIRIEPATDSGPKIAMWAALNLLSNNFFLKHFL
jgi:hypothetical protein